MQRLLVAGGTVVTMDPALGDLAKGDVLIESGRIVEVAPEIDCADAERIEAAGCLVMPGLVNAHLHTWQTPLRGIGGDWAGSDYDDILHSRLAPRYTPQDLHDATLFGALAQLDSGTTTVFDWCHNNPTPDHTDAGVEALAAAGIRAVFGHGSAKPPPAPGAPHFSTVAHDWDEIRRLRQGRFSSDDNLVTLAACILGPDYGTLDVCRTDFAEARALAIPTSAHVWGQSSRLVQDGYRQLAAEGLIAPGHNVVHGNYLSDDELDLLIDAGASFTSAPTVELRNHAREPLSVRLRRRGLVPSIGVDCEALACDRMLDALRFTLQAHRLFNNQAAIRDMTRAGGPPPDAAGSVVRQVSLTTREVLEWGTIGNARALGLADRIGSLTPGKQADLLVVRTDGPHVVPANDPAQVMIQLAQNSDIDTVLVAGQVVKRGGRLLHPGLDRARANATALAARLFATLPAELRARCALAPAEAA
jgi:cytosine/adenosine deaminase-related metal-dependent hydrolase